MTPDPALLALLRGQLGPCADRPAHQRPGWQPSSLLFRPNSSVCSGCRVEIAVPLPRAFVAHAIVATLPPQSPFDRIRDPRLIVHALFRRPHPETNLLRSPWLGRLCVPGGPYEREVKSWGPWPPGGDADPLVLVVENTSAKGARFPSVLLVGDELWS